MLPQREKNCSACEIFIGLIGLKGSSKSELTWYLLDNARKSNRQGGAIEHTKSLTSFFNSPVTCFWLFLSVIPILRVEPVAELQQILPKMAILTIGHQKKWKSVKCIVIARRGLVLMAKVACAVKQSHCNGVIAKFESTAIVRRREMR